MIFFSCLWVTYGFRSLCCRFYELLENEIQVWIPRLLPKYFCLHLLLLPTLLCISTTLLLMLCLIQRFSDLSATFFPSSPSGWLVRGEFLFYRAQALIFWRQNLGSGSFKWVLGSSRPKPTLFTNIIFMLLLTLARCLMLCLYILMI